MKITTTVDIPPRRIADLFVTAIEGGCNYWCDGVFLKSSGDVPFDHRTEDKQPWYDVETFYNDPGLRIQVVDAESPEVEHIVTLPDIKRAFELMQTFGTPKGYCWRDFLDHNDDAITADVFLQLATFGDVIYG